MNGILRYRNFLLILNLSQCSSNDLKLTVSTRKRNRIKERQEKRERRKEERGRKEDEKERKKKGRKEREKEKGNQKFDYEKNLEKKSATYWLGPQRTHRIQFGGVFHFYRILFPGSFLH